MANTPSTIFYDMSEEFATNTFRSSHKLSSTGRMVDDSFKDSFSKEAALVDSQKKAIYETEKAKGTPAAEIYAKLIDFTNSQSHDYLEGTGWLGKESA
jgi:hypothetical protein